MRANDAGERHQVSHPLYAADGLRTMSMIACNSSNSYGLSNRSKLEIDCQLTATKSFPSASPRNQNSCFIKVFRTKVEQLRDLEIGENHVIILVFDFSVILDQ
jgi:hypothetical protein